MLNALYWWALIALLCYALWRGNRGMLLGRAPIRFLPGADRDYREERSRAGGLVNILLSFKVPSDISFRLNRESWFDRFGKGLRLAVEPQIGEQGFDARFYIDTSNSALIDLLRREPRLRTLLMMLQTRLKQQGTDFHWISCADGMPSIYLGVTRAHDVSRLRGECVHWMLPLAEALRGLPPSAQRAIPRWRALPGGHGACASACSQRAGRR